MHSPSRPPMPFGPRCRRIASSGRWLRDLDRASSSWVWWRNEVGAVEMGDGGGGTGVARESVLGGRSGELVLWTATRWLRGDDITPLGLVEIIPLLHSLARTAGGLRHRAVATR